MVREEGGGRGRRKKEADKHRDREMGGSERGVEKQRESAKEAETFV